MLTTIKDQIDATLGFGMYNEGDLVSALYFEGIDDVIFDDVFSDDYDNHDVTVIHQGRAARVQEVITHSLLAAILLGDGEDAN